jgi:hypothetical protein
MRNDALQRGLPAPDEACAKHHYLHQRVEAPDLATIKIFLRFYIATSCGRIIAKPTVDSINTVTELTGCRDTSGPQSLYRPRPREKPA